MMHGLEGLAWGEWASLITFILFLTGHYSYHFPLDYWELFEEIPVKSFDPTYDGHKPEGISRLLSL